VRAKGHKVSHDGVMSDPVDPDADDLQVSGAHEGSDVSEGSDVYEGSEEYEAHIEKLFADPEFTRRQRERQILQPKMSRSANGSFGRAMALGFANVFDPDRVKEDIVVVQKRGDGDDDVPDTVIDPDDPTSTKVVYKLGRTKPQ
jgi:hypothetical protein